MPLDQFLPTADQVMIVTKCVLVAVCCLSVMVLGMCASLKYWVKEKK